MEILVTSSTPSSTKMFEENIIDVLVNPTWSKPICAGLFEVSPRWKYHAFEAPPIRRPRSREIFRPDPFDAQVSNPRSLNMGSSSSKKEIESFPLFKICFYTLKDKKEACDCLIIMNKKEACVFFF